MVQAQPEVVARFQPLFSPERIPSLTREEFSGFLVLRNNKHWNGLHRGAPAICQDMGRLRAALALLLDESRPIEKRLDLLDPKDGELAVPRMGRAVMSAILLVAHPDRYGVWNSTSQGGMEAAGIWPSFDRGEPLGGRYRKVNEILLAVAGGLGIDLWALDGIWWFAGGEDQPGDAEAVLALGTTETSETESPATFGLERHLHEFMRDNWEKTSLGKEWGLYVEDGDLAGYEYPCPLGRIDLLAKHKTKKSWLVVELKRDQSSDATIGQVLRYMGWVKAHLAEHGDEVEGLVVCHSGDEKIRYALTMTGGVKLMVYEVDFRLKAAT